MIPVVDRHMRYELWDRLAPPSLSSLRLDACVGSHGHSPDKVT